MTTAAALNNNQYSGHNEIQKQYNISNNTTLRVSFESYYNPDKYGFGVKKIQFVYSNIDKEAIMVLVKAIKNGRIGSLRVAPPIDIRYLGSYKNIFT